MTLCHGTDGEACTTDHEPMLGRCDFCSTIKACVVTADLNCGHNLCCGRIVTYPYIQQAELRAAYRLGGIDAVEAIVRPKCW